MEILLTPPEVGNVKVRIKRKVEDDSDSDEDVDVFDETFKKAKYDHQPLTTAVASVLQHSLVTQPKGEDTIVVPSGVFPRLVRQASFNLFGLAAVPFSFYTLHQDDSRRMRESHVKDPIYCSGVVDKAIKIGELLECCAGSALGAIEVDQMNIVYQNVAIDKRYTKGLTLSATVTVNDSHKELHHLLCTVLGVAKPELALSCNTPDLPSWHEPFSIGSYTFTAALDNVAASPFTGLTVTALSLEVQGFRGYELNDESGMMYPARMYSLVVAGSLDIDLAAAMRLGGGKPIKADFSLGKTKSEYDFQVRLKLDWKDAFGWRGLTLRRVALRAEFDTSAAWDSITLSLGCNLDIAGTTVTVCGRLSFKGDFNILFSMSNITWDTIKAIQQHFFPDEAPLDTPDIEFSVSKASISISSRHGLVLQLDQLRLGDYVGMSGTLAINKTGGLLDFSLAGDGLHLGDFEIKQAHLTAEIQLGDKSSGTVKKSGSSYSLGVSGRVIWKSLDVAVGVRLYKLPGVDGLQYTIYGSLTDTKGGFRLGEHIPGIESTPLGDVVLNKVLLIVASQSDNHPSLGLPAGYEVQKGLQLAIDVGACDSLAKLFNQDNMGLIMAVQWDPAFPLGVNALIRTKNMPKLAIGDDFETGDVQLMLTMNKFGPKLSFSADARLALHGEDGKKDYLDFTVIGALDMIGVTITGIMKGLWNIPFDLCRKLTIGPRLELTLGISYALVPTEFGFVGGMTLGKVRADVAVKASKTPEDQLISISCQNLDLSDVVMLISDNEASGPAPDDVVAFKNVFIYVCPFGTKQYPRGFIFDCEAVFLGKVAHAHVEITDSGLVLSASVDAFDLGPFRISGAEDYHAKLRGELTLTKDKRCGGLSGRIRGAALDCSIIGGFSLDPFIIAFRFDLNFFDLFDIKVAIGPIPPESGAIAKTAASILDSGLRLEGMYQDTGLHDLLSHTIREWRTALHADCERRRVQAAKAIADGLDRGEVSLDDLWNGIVGELEGVAADIVAPLIQEILDAFYLRHIHIRADIHPGMSGFSFTAEIAGSVKGTDFYVNIELVLGDIGEMIKNFVMKLMAKFAHLIEDIIDKIQDELGDKIKSIAEGVLNAIEKAAEELVNDAIEFGKDVGEGAQMLVDKADELLEDAKDEIVRAADEAGETIGEFVNDIEDALSDFGSDVGDAVEDIGRGLDDAAEEIGRGFKDIGSGLESAAEDVSEAIEDVGHTVSNAVDAIGDFFSW